MGDHGAQSSVTLTGKPSEILKREVLERAARGDVTGALKEVGDQVSVALPPRWPRRPPTRTAATWSPP